MHGSSIGSLEFQLIKADSEPPISLWFLQGNQGYWAHGQYPLPDYQKMTDYSIRIIGKIGGPAGGDVAVDDISFQVNDCDGKRLHPLVML